MSSNMGSSGLPSGAGSCLSSSAPLTSCMSADLAPTPPGMGSPGFHPNAQQVSVTLCRCGLQNMSNALH